MLRILPISLTILVLASFPLVSSSAYAQNLFVPPVEDELDTPRVENAVGAQQIQEKVMHEGSERVKTQDRATRELDLEARRASVAAKFNELRAERVAKQAERKAAIEAKQAEMKTKHEELKASFQARLAELKDQNKAKVLENLNSRYPNINERWTTHFNNVLDRLEDVLAKIATHEVDTTAAKSAIDSARVVVDNQAAASYVIQITDESNLQSDAQTVHAQLKSDLTIARTAVQAAGAAVRAARDAARKTVVGTNQVQNQPQVQDSVGEEMINDGI